MEPSIDAAPGRWMRPGQEEKRISQIPLLNLMVALGIGLLIGGERERRKSQKGVPAPAGIRTFAVAALAGAVGFVIGGVVLLAVVTAALAVLLAIASLSAPRDDPGITTETALLLTVLLGALATLDPTVAAGVGVTVAVLLAARAQLHQFVASALSEREMRDALVFAGATLIVLPLLPNRAMGPWGAFNPHAMWVVAVLMLAISAAGHMAVRTLGARVGLPLVGLASGFISSIATISAMGTRSRADDKSLEAAVAGAVMSTVATIAQLALVLGAVSVPTLYTLAIPLASAGLAAVAYGAAFTALALRQPPRAEAEPSRAFSLSAALVLAAMLSLVLIGSAALRAGFGESGAIAAATVAGFFDTHAAGVSIAALVAGGKMAPAAAVIPILAGLTTNAITKLVFAATSGTRAFAVRVAPGIALVIAAAWLAAAVSGVLRIQ